MNRAFSVLPVLVFVLLSSTALAGPDHTSARIYRNQGDLLKAMEFFSSEIQRNPDNYVAIFERGEVFGWIAMDRTKKGVLRDLTEDGDYEDPQREVLSRMLADFNTVRGLEDPKARKSLRKPLAKIDEILEDYWGKLYNSAIGADTLSVAMADTAAEKSIAKAEEGIRYCDLAILVHAENWNTHALKGQILDRLDRKEEAIPNWEAALARIEASDLQKEDAAAYQESHQIILLHLLQDAYDLDLHDETIRYGEMILGTHPTLTDAHRFIAYAKTNKARDAAADTTVTEEERVQLREEALEALRTARETVPDDDVIAFYIGQFSLEKGDTAATLQAYGEYVEMDTTDFDVGFMLGYFYLEGGSFIDYVKAEEIYRMLTIRHPDKCDGWINLGVAQIKQERNEEGAKNVKKGEECAKALDE